MERKFSFMSAACLQENWVNLCTGKDLQGGVKNRRNQSFNFYVRRGERKEKKSFLLLNLFRSSPPFYQKLQIYGGGYKKLFFSPFPCYRYREVRLVSELWPPKGVSSQLDFYQRKKKMVKFYIAELYNLFPSFELAWLLSFSWEWGYKFWRKKNRTEVRYATWNWKQNTQWSILFPCLLIFFIYLRTFLGRGAVFALNRVWDELLVL